SIGRTLIILTYLAIVSSLITTVDAPRNSSHYVDDVAFRAAWMTLTQVPLVFLLGVKRGPLHLLAGLSYERINWVHRWGGRILFFSATTHMAIMMSSISVSDIVWSKDKIMLFVRFGVGAYGMLTWVAVTSILPIRKWSYRLFYLNHCLSTGVFLWVLFRHVPKYARNPIYLSVACLAMDTLLSWGVFIQRNICIRPVKRAFRVSRKIPPRKALALGHIVKMTTPKDGEGSSRSSTVIRISDIRFKWRPGQHVRIYIPRLGPFEYHPFTPATYPTPRVSRKESSKKQDVEQNNLLSQAATDVQNDMILMIKTHSGFTRRLTDYYRRWLALPCPNASRSSYSLTAFVDGPFGFPPEWKDFESLFLIATSTGVSFTLSILDYLAQLCRGGDAAVCTKRVRFLWVVRHLDSQLDSTVTEMLHRHSETLKDFGIAVDAQFFATCPETQASGNSHHRDPFAHLRHPRSNFFANKPPLRLWSPEDEELYSEPTSTDGRMSFVSDRSLTLIDGGEPQAEAEELDPYSRGRFRWRSLIPTFNGYKEVSKTEENGCGCAVLSNQPTRRKIRDLIVRSDGVRPDIPEIMRTMFASGHRDGGMVGVCANLSMTAETKNAVARMNIESVRGRRERELEIYSEGFV
ncbi:hypothetical protein P154DRAFT_447515, partial [Amniculicola lignicola CBS 123094]